MAKSSLVKWLKLPPHLFCKWYCSFPASPARRLWFVFPDLVLFLVSYCSTLRSCWLLPPGSPSLCGCGLSAPPALQCSWVGGPWGRSPSPAENGVSMAQTDPLNSVFEIVVHLSSGYRLCCTAWPDFYFFFKLENVLLMAAMTSLVSLLPSFKDLCWKMDVVLIYLFFSAFLWVSHKNYFYRRKTYFFLYLICANDESVLVFLPSPFQKKKKEARIQQGRFEPERCYWIHSYNRKCRAVVESR